MKTHTTLTVDQDLFIKVKSLGVNISGLFNDYLESYIVQQSQDLEGINIELEKIKRDKLIKAITETQNELRQCEKNIEVWKLAKAKDEETKLKEEKERIEESKKCIQCLTVFDKNYKEWSTVPAGIVCKACFLSSTKEMRVSWGI